MGGSFQRPQDSLEQIIKKRLSRKAGTIDEYGNLVVSGFQTQTESKDSQDYKNLQKDAQEEDYIHFGIIPELVGRTPIRSYVNALSKNDLVRIMNDTEDSLLKQYQLEFKAFQIDLQFADDAIEYVAERAERNKTGARALIGVWEDILTDFQYELPGTSHRHLLVDRTVCEAPKDYLLKLLSRSPFEHFCEMFQTEHGIRLVFDAEAEDYVQSYAKNGHIQVSEALKILLTGASALNYMGYCGQFQITREMLEDPRYFDSLYVRWHEEQLGQSKNS